MPQEPNETVAELRLIPINGFDPMLPGQIVQGTSPTFRARIKSNYHIGWARAAMMPNYNPETNGAVTAVEEGLFEYGVDLPEGDWLLTWSYVLPTGNMFWAQSMYRYRKVVVEPPPTPAPATWVPANNLTELKNALNAGATQISTTGLTIDQANDIDFKGATLQLLRSSTDNYTPAVHLKDKAKIRNVCIRTPSTQFPQWPSFNSRKFWYGVIIDTSATVTMENVLFKVSTIDEALNSPAPQLPGMCVHVSKGTLKATNVWVHRFTEYFVFQEKDTFVEMGSSGTQTNGGSLCESCYRSAAGRYTLAAVTIDNRGGGKAAIRGDSPPYLDGSPGGVITHSTIYGQVGPNPLTEDDGGQMVGVDRWRVEGQGNWLFQLPGDRKPEVLAYLKQLRDAGKPRLEVIRLMADKFIDPAQLSAATRSPGKTRLSDYEITLTDEFRKAELGRRSKVAIVGSTITGSVRFNSRVDLSFTSCTIEGVEGGPQVITGDSQYTYPWPIDRLIDPFEAQGLPKILLDKSTIQPNKLGIGIDMKPGTPWAKAITLTNGAVIKATPVD